MLAKQINHRTATSNDVLDLANIAEIGSFMSRVFSSQGEARRPQDQHIEHQPDIKPALDTDFEDLDTLLNRASKALEFLAARCAIMEQEASDKDERIAEHEQAAKQWQQFAVKLQAQTASDQNTIADLMARSDAADARIASLEADVSEAHERSATAYAKSTKLQSQVVAAFGRKSPVHSVLQTITFQEAAE